MDAEKVTNQKDSCAKTVDEKPATRAVRPPSFLTTTTSIAVHASSSSSEDQADTSVFQMAYRKWVNANPNCSCTKEHSDPRIPIHIRDNNGNVVGTTYYKPLCDRDRSWWIWVKVRDGGVLSAEDIAFVGFS